MHSSRSIFEFASTINVIVLANALSVLAILRIRAQNEVRF
jgi:hypothetical protein